MPPFRPLLLALVLAWALVGGEAFLVKPCLQLGARSSEQALSLLWHGPDEDPSWRVERRPAGGQWRPVAAPTWVRVAVPSIEPHRVYTALLGRRSLTFRQMNASGQVLDRFKLSRQGTSSGSPW